MASTPLPLATPSFNEAGLGLLRLFRIEVRRSLGFVLFPVLVGISWFVADQQPYYDKPQGVALWPADSLRVGFAAVLVAPFVAAMLSWEAGRERRRHIDDLLITTPLPAFARDLTRWAGTSAWALLAYSAVGLAVLIPTARAATWGGPLIGALLMGVVLVPVAGAVGYLVGAIFPSRFTPPLVGIAIYAVEAGVAAQHFAEYKYLSPFTNFLSIGDSQTGLFYNVDPNLFAESALWLVAVGTIALATVALRRNASSTAMAAFGASLLFGFVAASPLVGVPDQRFWQDTLTISYEPVCAEETVPVCLHPAYESLLPRTADIVSAVIAPLTGFPGGITRAEQTAFGPEPDSDGVFQFHLYDLSMGEARFAGSIAATVFMDLNDQTDNCFGLLDNAQYAVAAALVARGGWTFDPPMGTGFTCETSNFSPTGGMEIDPNAAAVQTDIKAAADRFAALSVEEQRAWFEKHYAALRAGELTLDDLP